MRNWLTVFTLLITTALTFSACGPSVSSRDQENKQIQDNIQRKAAELSPYAGIYYGTIRNVTTSKTFPVRLFLQLVTKQLPNSGRTDVITVPILVGGLMACEEKKTTTCTTDLTPISSGTFNSNTQQLELSGSWGDSDNFFTLNVKGDTLEGSYVSKREYSYVTVTRMQDDKSRR